MLLVTLQLWQQIRSPKSSSQYQLQTHLISSMRSDLSKQLLFPLTNQHLREKMRKILDLLRVIKCLLLILRLQSVRLSQRMATGIKAKRAWSRTILCSEIYNTLPKLRSKAEELQRLSSLQSKEDQKFMLRLKTSISNSARILSSRLLFKEFVSRISVCSQKLNLFLHRLSIKVLPTL